MIAQRIMQMSSYLSSLGLSPSEVQEYTDNASQEIHENLVDLVSNAVKESEMSADEMSADDFLKEIELDSSSGYVQIGTSSGKLDFSEPPYPMLPWLLKNPKVAKDGTLYKVIPIGASSGDQRSATVKDIDAAIKRLTGSSKASDMASSMASAFGMGGAVTKYKESEIKPAKAFRVASSKQDSSTDWVKPATNKDMTATVMSINARLRSDIDNLVDQVVNKYMSMAENMIREY